MPEVGETRVVDYGHDLMVKDLMDDLETGNRVEEVLVEAIKESPHGRSSSSSMMSSFMTATSLPLDLQKQMIRQQQVNMLGQAQNPFGQFLQQLGGGQNGNR